MKKCVALVLAITMVIMLAGCRIVYPGESLDEQLYSVNDEGVIPNIYTDNEDGTSIIDVLTILVNTKSFENWLAVAKCEYANEDLLMQVAKNAKYNTGTGMAEALLANPNTTEAVLKTLVDESMEEFVIVINNSDRVNRSNLLAVAAYEDASEEILLIIAKDARVRKDSELAEALLKNPAITGLVVNELATSMDKTTLECIANSDKATENALKIIAEKVVYGKDDKIAKDIVKNVNTTGEVMEILAELRIISSVVASSDKSNEATLLNVARYAIGCKDKTLVELIITNPNVTDTVLEEIAESDSEEIANMAHAAIEAMNETE